MLHNLSFDESTGVWNKDTVHFTTMIGGYSHATVTRDVYGTTINYVLHNNDMPIYEGGDDADAFSDESDEDGENVKNTDYDERESGDTDTASNSQSGSSYSHSTSIATSKSQSFVCRDYIKYNRMIFDFAETTNRIALCVPSLYCASLVDGYLWWRNIKYSVTHVVYAGKQVTVTARTQNDKHIFCFIRDDNVWQKVIINGIPYTVVEFGTGTKNTKPQDSIESDDSDSDYETCSDSD